MCVKTRPAEPVAIFFLPRKFRFTCSKTLLGRREHDSELSTLTTADFFCTDQNPFVIFVYIYSSCLRGHRTEKDFKTCLLC